MMQWIFSVILFIGMGLQASAFDNPYNHGKEKSIRKVKVFGERASGTNFLFHLIHENFPSLKKVGTMEYGHKHYLWWLGVDKDFEPFSRINYRENAISFNHSDDCLFVIIIRDPYDWLRSFYLSPWEVHQSLLHKGFTHFISKEWRGCNAKNYPFPDIDNYNPYTGFPFRNVLELRSAKIQNALSLSKRVKNFCIVRYEDVDEDPEGFIEYLSQKFSIGRKKAFVPITTNKGNKRVPYQKKTYFSIKAPDLEFINREMDWETESLIGYEMKTVVKCPPLKLSSSFNPTGLNSSFISKSVLKELLMWRFDGN